MTSANELLTADVIRVKLEGHKRDKGLRSRNQTKSEMQEIAADILLRAHCCPLSPFTLICCLIFSFLKGSIIVVRHV